MDRTRPELNKVPQVTLAFWIIKICATTLGETGGDAVSMTLGLGYLAATALFFVIFLGVAAGQVGARRYHPWLYWAVILATTTAGTTLSDFLDRTAHLGYLWGSVLLLSVLGAILLAWRLVLGRIVFQHVADRRVESFYWAAILVSNTLGTALGDYTSDEAGLGFIGAAVLFGALIALVALAYFFTKAPPCAAVLGCLRADAPAGRDARRHPDKAGQSRWDGARHLPVLCGPGAGGRRPGGAGRAQARQRPPCVEAGRRWPASPAP